MFIFDSIAVMLQEFHSGSLRKIRKNVFSPTEGFDNAAERNEIPQLPNDRDDSKANDFHLGSTQQGIKHHTSGVLL